MIYFKSETHKEYTYHFLKKFGLERLEDDRSTGAFCYIAAATYQYDDFIQVISPDGIDMESIEQYILKYSSSEAGMIRFALQLYHSELDDIILSDFIYGLDPENKWVIIEAIKFRFHITPPVGSL